jgi:hypothetical protein
MAEQILDLPRMAITPSTHELRAMIIRDHTAGARSAAATLDAIKELKLGPKPGEYCPTWRKIIGEFWCATLKASEIASERPRGGETASPATTHHPTETAASEARSETESEASA